MQSLKNGTAPVASDKKYRSLTTGEIENEMRNNCWVYQIFAKIEH
jgi:hypothetical protein